MKKLSDLTPAERLEQLRQRCHINDDGCWIWKGDRYTSGQPRAIVEGRRRGSAKSLARTLVGKPAPKKYETCRCDLAPNDCINPDHLRNYTRGQVLEVSNRDNKAVHVERAAKTKRARRALSDRMTMQLAREIRSSSESGAAIARRLNLGADYVRQIRRGTMWREVVSPWAGLGAR